VASNSIYGKINTVFCRKIIRAHSWDAHGINRASSENISPCDIRLKHIVKQSYDWGLGILIGIRCALWRPMASSSVLPLLISETILRRLLHFKSQGEAGLAFSSHYAILSFACDDAQLFEGNRKSYPFPLESKSKHFPPFPSIKECSSEGSFKALTW
jgi:hypothetical protein